MTKKETKEIMAWRSVLFAAKNYAYAVAKQGDDDFENVGLEIARADKALEKAARQWARLVKADK